MPLVRTTKHELYDLVGIFSRIFLIFWYPSEQILGPGGQVGPGPNTFHRTPKTRVRTFFLVIPTDLPTYIRGSLQTAVNLSYGGFQINWRDGFFHYFFRSLSYFCARLFRHPPQ